MKKNLLIFGYTLAIGGAEKALIDMINYLEPYYNIDLYLLEKQGDLLSDVPKKVNIYQMKKNFFQYVLFRCSSFYRKRVINRIANTKDYKCALGYMEGRCGTWVADIKKNIKKYAWIHNDVFKFDIGISDAEVKDSYSKLDKVICVSKESKNNFCEKYNIPASKVEVIYNYINEEEILKKSSAFPVHNDCITFVNVAKMRDQKRQDRLVMAAKILKEKGYKFKIQLIGDGPNLEKIRDMVYNCNLEDVVEVMGLQINPYPYVKNADYFVLTSYMEGYGIVIKEALLLKKKIISTDVVGPREILENGKYGVIIPNDDSAVAQVLESVLKNPHIYDYLEETLSFYEGDNEYIKKQIFKLLNL